MHALSYQEREEILRLVIKRNSFVWMCAKLFWRYIYCANPRRDLDSQSSSLSWRGFRRKDTWIICDYNLATAIAIRLLTHPHTCEMISSIFSTISRLKFASMTRASFPSIPSTERTNAETFSIASVNSYRACPYYILSTQ